MHTGIMKTDSDLGPRIRALRLSRQLSLAEVAAGTGVSEATMSRIETGHSQVSAPHLYGLAQMFGVEIADFFRRILQVSVKCDDVFAAGVFKASHDGHVLTKVTMK